jgi:hypothetical protein
MVRRKTRAAARLLILPHQGAATPLLSRCVRASSLLPSRAQPGKTFLIVDGTLHALDAQATPPAIMPIATEPTGVIVTQLLASSRQEPPIELLVLVQPAGKGRVQVSPRLWHLVVSQGRARGEPVRDEPWLQSRDAFFARYHAPRCRDDGSDCLVVVDSDSGAFLDVQPQPRAPRHEWKVLEGARIHDASWNPADAGSALALVTCDEDQP